QQAIGRSDRLADVPKLERDAEQDDDVENLQPIHSRLPVRGDKVAPANHRAQLSDDTLSRNSAHRRSLAYAPPWNRRPTAPIPRSTRSSAWPTTCGSSTVASSSSGRRGRKCRSRR